MGVDRIAAGRQADPVMEGSVQTGEFSIGRVIARGLGAVARRPVATAVPALLYGVAPALLFAYATDGVESGDEVIAASIVASLWVAAVTNVLSQGTLAPAVFHEDAAVERGERSTLRFLWPLLAAGALVGAATVAAGAFLLLPGLLLYSSWSVAGPVIAEERLGALAALRRSAALVRPFFWRVVLLNLLSVAAYFAFWLALGLTGLYLWHGSAAFTGDGATPLPLGCYLVAAPFLTVATAAWGAVVVALYADLRERRDGVPADRLERIFA